MHSLPSLPQACETSPEHSQCKYWPATYQSLSDARLPKTPTSFRDPCHRLRIVLSFFRPNSPTHFSNPFLQRGVIQGLPPYSQDCRRILNLSPRLRQLRPFQFRDDYVLGARDKQRDVMQAHPLATPEFLLAEGARVADDQINLPARCQVDHIKHRLSADELPGPSLSRRSIRCPTAPRPTVATLRGLASITRSIPCVDRGTPQWALANEPVSMEPCPLDRASW